MTQPELTALIRNARAGEAQAQETLIREIQDRVYYHCKKMLKNESDAQDAAQDVLIAVLTGLDKLREPAAFYGWVNGITANRCKHLLTQGNREWQIPEDEDGGSMLDDLEDLDQQSVPEAVLDNKETQRLMLEIIDALPPDQRMCVLFYYYDEMSVKDIAQAMETSEGTVKSRLNYARKSIKAGVEDLERRGTKLYGIAPLPLLLLFLRMEAAQSGMSAAQSAGLTASVLSAVHGGSLGAGAAAGGAAAGGTAAGGAVTGGTAAGGAVTGGTAAGAAASGAAAKAGMALGTKIVIGVLSVLAAAGAAFGGFQLTKFIVPEPEPPVRVEEPAPEPLEDEEPLPEEPPEPEGPSPELLALLDDIVYYGDPAQCKLTSGQAAAFAEVIRQETDKMQEESRRYADNAPVNTCAALFDVGDGTPALFFGGGAESVWSPSVDGEVSWATAGSCGIWQYQDGHAVPYAPEGREPGGYWGQLLVLREDSLFIGGLDGSDGLDYVGGVYPLTGGTIAARPATSAEYHVIDPYGNLDEFRYQVDGAEVTAQAFEAWRDRWEKQPDLCGHYWDGGVGGWLTGMGDGAAAADALAQYAVNEVLPEREDRPEGEGDPWMDEYEDHAPVSAPAPVSAYAAVYAQKVRELLASWPEMAPGPDSCMFDLIYIDGDDVPELVVSYPDYMDFIPHVNLYTVAGGTQLHTVKEELTAGLRGSGMYYYPRQNAVRLDTADIRNMQWFDTTVYYRIDDEYRLKQIGDTLETEGGPQPLTGALTGEEILALLEP